MSTESNKLVVSFYSQEQIMVPLIDVAFFHWDKDKGARMKRLRGKVSRRELAVKLRAAGCQCSHQYLQKIESGTAEAVAAPIVAAICETLGATLAEIIPTMTVSSPK